MPLERPHDRTHPMPEPLPGTGVPRRGLFVSRWGALLERPGRKGLPRFDPALLAPGAVEALFRIGQRSWNVYLVGNEPDVALGRASDEEWQAFERALLDHLAGQGVRVARQYACLEDPRGKGRHKPPARRAAALGALARRGAARPRARRRVRAPLSSRAAPASPVA
jgi:hypothetical protein